MAGQFSDFYSSLDSDPLKRGKQFEHFVKWFLKADPEWSTQVDQVWLWEEWPHRWGADCGIDLVVRHKNGDNWAVQAKCYSPEHDITKHDVDKFLSESNRPLIQHRLLIATTDRIGNNAKQVCNAQDKPVVRFLLSDFERSLLDYPASLAKLNQGKRKAPPKPFDHQNEAITDVANGLETADSGQLIMACGTGKTFTTLWIKEKLGAARTLVLLPSLGLLAQTLREWTFAASTPFEVLCVCSDQTVGAKGADEVIHSVGDLAFPVTSDAEEVKRFLSGTGNRVVFSTYQSSPVIAEAQTDLAIPAFDLAVADEAHRCAGKVGSDFTTILDNAQIRSSKRLFATATPRTYSSTVHKAAEDRGVEVVGMDNISLFGEVLYALPFGKAIEKKLLTDYRVIIIGVDDPTIAGWIANRELVTTGTGIDTDSESLAAQIGLLKAIKDYDLKRIISFHSRVNRAEVFTTDIQYTMKWISDEHRPSGTLHTDFVSGNMPANKRKMKLDQLKGLGADERGVLSNARCLSEGVDVPSLDGVAFIDPRSSQVDIIQAVGRAIRLSPDKKAGTIVLPVFIAAGEDATSTIEASNFKPIWEVLNALKAHDNVLADELDQIRTEMGRKSGSGFKGRDLNKIIIDLPATVDANFSSALRTYLVEQVTAPWNFMFGVLEQYVETNGTSLVRRGYVTTEGYRLDRWVQHQRSLAQNKQLMFEREEHLRSIGFVFDPFDNQWLKNFEELRIYFDANGNSNINSRHSNRELARWVVKQRVAYRDGRLPDWKSDKLKTIQFEFERNEFDRKQKDYMDFISARKFVQSLEIESSYEYFDWARRKSNKYGAFPDCLPRSPQQVYLEDGWKDWSDFLGQKTKDAQNQLRWEEKFREYQEYIKLNGGGYIDTKISSKRLANWVNTQRQYFRQGELDSDRMKRLESIGMSFNPMIEAWEYGFSNLMDFVKVDGHSVVPQSKVLENGFPLGVWVNTQRRKKDKLTSECIERLEALPGWVWRVKSE